MTHFLWRPKLILHRYLCSIGKYISTMTVEWIRLRCQPHPFVSLHVMDLACSYTDGSGRIFSSALKPTPTLGTLNMYIVFFGPLTVETNIMHLRRQYDPTYQPLSDSHSPSPSVGEPLTYSLGSLLLWRMLLVLQHRTANARLNVESSSQLVLSLHLAAWYAVLSP